MVREPMVREQIARVRRLVTFHLVTLAFLTACLVAPMSSQLSHDGQSVGSVFLPLLVLVVGVSSLIFVDILEWFSLHHILAYCFMVLGTVLSLYDYFWGAGNGSASGQLLAIASLLIYPEIVIMLQKKSMRLFEQMAIFLLLEIIVAALVNDNILFGVLLAPIVILWVSSLLLLTRYAALVQLIPTLDVPAPKLVEFLKELWRKARAAKFPPSSPMLHVIQPERAPHGNVSLFTLSGQSIPIGVASIAFAGLYFYMLPRASQEIIATNSAVARTGLANSLTLGQTSEILKDDTAIMRLSLTDVRTGDAYRLLAPPYIRGTVVGIYHSTIGRISFEGFEDGHKPSDRQRLSSSKSVLDSLDRDKVVTRFELLEPEGTALPCIAPMVNNDSSQQFIDAIPFDWRLVNARASMITGRTKQTMDLLTSAFKDGHESPLLPDSRTLLFKPSRNDAEQYLSRLHSFSRVNERSYAPDWANKFWQDVRERYHDAISPIQLARAAEQYFSESEEFSYSLNQRQSLDADIDPIREFVTSRKRGNCQSFAAALTLALRQQKIAARIVLGYHPLEYNEIGHYFTIRNRDAHAWVEAYFSHEELVAEGLASVDAGPYGAWLRLDPTPPGEGSNAGRRLRSQQRPAAIADYAEQLWNDLFLNSRHKAEEHTLYGPLQDSTIAIYSQLIDTAQAFVKRLRESELAGGAINRDSWIIGPLIALVCSIIAFVVLLWRLLRALPNLVPSLAQKLGFGQSSHTIAQQFYRHCLRLLQRAGYKRLASQTPREYTEATARQLISERGWLEANENLGLLTSAYYSLRFGQLRALDPQEQRRVAAALLQLEKALSKN